MAYRHWSYEDDVKVWEDREIISIVEGMASGLGDDLGRSEGAIFARLDHLGDSNHLAYQRLHKYYRGDLTPTATLVARFWAKDAEQKKGAAKQRETEQITAYGISSTVKPKPNRGPDSKLTVGFDFMRPWSSSTSISSTPSPSPSPPPSPEWWEPSGLRPQLGNSPSQGLPSACSSISEIKPPTALNLQASEDADVNAIVDSLAVEMNALNFGDKSLFHGEASSFDATMPSIRTTGRSSFSFESSTSDRTPRSFVSRSSSDSLFVPSLSLAAAISAGTIISEPVDHLGLPCGMPRNDSKRLYLPTSDAVYVLKCSHEKYYVGRTSATRLEQRLSEHASGKGCYWTKLHPPLEVVEIVSPAYPYAEEAVTLRYMEAFGMNDVRGGSKARAFLNKADVVTVTRSLRNEKNLCMECGSPDHWVDDCPSLDGGTKGGRTVSDDGKEKEKESDDNAERKDSGPANAKKTAKPQAKAKKNVASAGSSEEAAPASWTTRNGKYCTRCGRNSHWESECFAKNHIDGTPLTRSYFSYKKPTRGGKRW